MPASAATAGSAGNVAHSASANAVDLKQFRWMVMNFSLCVSPGEDRRRAAPLRIVGGKARKKSALVPRAARVARCCFVADRNRRWLPVKSRARRVDFADQAKPAAMNVAQ